ncbi:MAG: nitroreductase family protein [Planctomycetota bacterium]
MSDFWEILYGRRSIRKFDKTKPVPKELIEKVLDAAIWAPSSCNYQMWDFVVVNDPKLNEELGKLSTQMANAPVNIIVAYGRDYSEEAWANIQSASAAIENMSLAAHALGLGTFWITQTGDPEKVREMVGLPYERMVVAVLALGYPAVFPKRAPKRRGLPEVAHWNHYAGRPVPSSRKPKDWDLDLIRIYQRARVRNGNRHNKPKEWERDAILDAFNKFRVPAQNGKTLQILDLLPTHGLYTELISASHRDLHFTICDLSPEVLEFSTPRTVEPARGILYSAAPEAVRAEGGGPFPLRAPKAEFDMALALFRLENLPPAHRNVFLQYAFDALRPGGTLILGYVNSKSYQNAMERVRLRGSGPKGVEYILAPDPSIGPFEPLSEAEVRQLLQKAGFKTLAKIGYHALPPKPELEWRFRNKTGFLKKVLTSLGSVAHRVNQMQGLLRSRGRLQFVKVERPS